MLVKKEEYDRRINICKTCRCKLSWKAKLKNQNCPQEKWESIK